MTRFGSALALTFTLAVSLAANITWAARDGDFVAIAAGIATPIALVMAVHQWRAHTSAVGYQRVLRVLGMAAVTGTAAAWTWTHTTRLLLAHQLETPLAYIAPLAVDGLAVMATMALWPTATRRETATAVPPDLPAESPAEEDEEEPEETSQPDTEPQPTPEPVAGPPAPRPRRLVPRASTGVLPRTPPRLAPSPPAQDTPPAPTGHKLNDARAWYLHERRHDRQPSAKDVNDQIGSAQYVKGHHLAEWEQELKAEAQAAAAEAETPPLRAVGW